MIRKGIHPSAVVDFRGEIEIPLSTVIEPGVLIYGGPKAKLKFGEKNTIYPGVVIRIEHGSLLTGIEVSFGPGCMIYEPRGGLVIGDHCLIAGGVIICGVEHTFDDLSTPIRHQRAEVLGVEIEEDCWIGMGAKILPGVMIGRGSVIGAGSVVTKSIPAGSIARGVPCKVVRSR